MLRVLREDDETAETGIDPMDQSLAMEEVPESGMEETLPSEPEGLQELIQAERVLEVFAQLDGVLQYLKDLGTAVTALRVQSYQSGEAQTADETLMEITSSEQEVLASHVELLSVVAHLQNIMQFLPLWMRVMQGPAQDMVEGSTEDLGLPSDEELSFPESVQKQVKRILSEVGIYGVTNPNQNLLQHVSNLMVVYLNSAQAVEMAGQVNQYREAMKTDQSAAQKALGEWIKSQFGPMLKWWKEEISSKSDKIIPQVTGLLIQKPEEKKVPTQKPEQTPPAKSEKPAPVLKQPRNAQGRFTKAPAPDVTPENVLRFVDNRWLLGERKFPTLKAMLESLTPDQVAQIAGVQAE